MDLTDTQGKRAVSSKATAKTAAKKKAASKKTVAKKTAAKKAAAKKLAGKSESDSATSKKQVVTTAAQVKEESADTGGSKKSVAKKKVAKKKSAAKVENVVESEEVGVVDGVDYDQDDDLDSGDLPTGASKAPVPYERNAGHYMDASQLAHFSDKLAQWKQQLMEEVDRTVDHMKDDATNFPDPNDRATQEEEFSLELRTRDRERKLIKKINEAQKRIDDDEYGYCETCGIEIGVSRLEARPTAELCIDCKTLEEIRERQTA